MTPAQLRARAAEHRRESKRLVAEAKRIERELFEAGRESRTVAANRLKAERIALYESATTEWLSGLSVPAVADKLQTTRSSVNRAVRKARRFAWRRGEGRKADRAAVAKHWDGKSHREDAGWRGA